MKVELVDQKVVEATARIMGASSACQLALDDAKARRERGEDVVFARRGHAILVLPRSSIATEGT